MATTQLYRHRKSVKNSGSFRYTELMLNSIVEIEK